MSITHVECNIISSLAITSRLIFQCLNLQHNQAVVHAFIWPLLLNALVYLHCGF